jgi:UDP-N-acetylmuramate dehydrogenase
MNSATDAVSIPLKEVKGAILSQVDLSDLTTYRVGGPAEWFSAPQNQEQLQAVREWAHQQSLPITVLGAGSNLLISDRGLPGFILSTRYLRQQTIDAASGLVIVEAGKPLPRLCWQVAEQGLSGLEWAVGVPGTVGGAVVMNAGAHDGTIADSLVSAEVLHPNGQVSLLSREDLHYGYRTSSLQGSPIVVLRATFQLTPGIDPEIVAQTTQRHRDHRLKTQPYDQPSCGSVFRNPLPQKAGWLIEQSGLKGFRIGGAQVSPKHANFIVNCGNATANDIYTLISVIQKKILDKWELSLHPEVKMLGDFELAL